VEIRRRVLPLAPSVLRDAWGVSPAVYWNIRVLVAWLADLVRRTRSFQSRLRGSASALRQKRSARSHAFRN